MAGLIVAVLCSLGPLSVGIAPALASTDLHFVGVTTVALETDLEMDGVPVVTSESLIEVDGTRYHCSANVEPGESVTYNPTFPAHCRGSAWVLRPTPREWAFVVLGLLIGAVGFVTTYLVFGWVGRAEADRRAPAG